MSFEKRSYSQVVPGSRIEPEGISRDTVIRITNISKCYEIYETPRDRLNQFVFPPLQRLIGKPLGKYFREFRALNDVTFEIKKGETVGIIGRNGSGKSTLLQMICGTLAPSSGTVETYGRIAALLELGSGFNPEFTGRENVYMNASILGLKSEEVDARYDDIVAFADIGEFIEQPVKSYSSGMIVRLAFAVTVYVDPEILIVDEALAVGDAVFQFKCLERLKKLTQSGTTLLFVSHDIEMVKNFCDRAIYLHKGNVKAEGPSEDIAEYYIMDVRDEQQSQSANAVHGIAKKQFVGAGEGIAFGTSQGRITKAYFNLTNGSFAAYDGKDVASFVVELEYRSDLEQPCIAVFLQTSKLVGIGGNTFPLFLDAGDNGVCRGRVSFDLPISLGSGDYVISIRLESRKNDLEFYPVDKQVGVLNFSVSHRKREFLGAVDIGLNLVDQQKL